LATIFLIISLKKANAQEKFLNRTAMACAVRSRIDKWDLMKLQSFCKAKDTVNQLSILSQSSSIAFFPRQCPATTH
jgi:hypothetical protein